jgi:hypothetical protein
VSLGIVASAHVVAGGPTTLFTEDWTGTNGAAWNATRWPNQRPSGSFIDTNKGILKAGNPSQAYCSLTVTDFEALIKYEWQVTIGGQFPEIAWRLGTNISSGTGSNGYVMQITGTGGSTGIYKITSGTYTLVGSSVTDATLNAIGIRWFRVRVVGNHHQVRWWTDGGSEPGTWQLDATDSTYTTGAFGIRAYQGADTLICDDLTITTP